MHTRKRVVPVTVRVSTLKGADAGLYYVEALPSYYLDAGEPAGHWRGDGALFLGLQGEVDDDSFLNLMAGLDPATGEPLGRAYGEDSVRGFDVTASAPKSVSVLFALGDDATRQAVLGAHDAAVASMVGWIENHAHTRYRIDGQVATLDAVGIAAACFRQHTSRALDPQLHTHVVIPNRVAADDGRWLALDARTIKFDQRTLSALYHAGLRAELTQSLGVAWEEPVRGIAEMRDVPEDVRSEFSSRHEPELSRTASKRSWSASPNRWSATPLLVNAGASSERPSPTAGRPSPTARTPRRCTGNGPSARSPSAKSPRASSLQRCCRRATDARWTLPPRSWSWPVHSKPWPSHSRRGGPLSWSASWRPPSPPTSPSAPRRSSPGSTRSRVASSPSAWSTCRAQSPTGCDCAATAGLSPRPWPTGF